MRPSTANAEQVEAIAIALTIANAVVFLASDQAGHITMHDLYIDGGPTLRA